MQTAIPKWTQSDYRLKLAWEVGYNEADAHAIVKTAVASGRDVEELLIAIAAIKKLDAMEAAK